MAFSNCSRLGDWKVRIFRFTLLEEIIIPNAVKTIKDMVFYVCSGLTTVTLGDGLEAIGEAAFR